MKKQLISVIVGALILFIYQFLSWGLLNLHGDNQRYTPNEEKILEALAQNLDEGNYFVPNLPPGASAADHEAFAQKWDGKPWATIQYHKSMETSMTMNLVRGMVIDLLAIWLLVWLFSKMDRPTFQTTVMASLAIGFIAYLTIPYLYTVWYKVGSTAYLIDTVIQWGLVGAWLGTRR
jgi:hypothetical protein